MTLDEAIKQVTYIGHATEYEVDKLYVLLDKGLDTWTIPTKREAEERLATARRSADAIRIILAKLAGSS